MAQVPHLVEIQNKFGPRGLQIIAVTTDNSDIVPRFLQEHRVNYGVVAHGSMSQLWGVQAVPAAFLVNPEGKVTWKGHPGTLTDTLLERQMRTSAAHVSILSPSQTTTVDVDDDSGKWLMAMVGAAIFFAGAMFFFWWKTRTPKWTPDYAAFDPKEVKKQQIREQMAQHNPQQQQPPADGVGSAQQVHVGQTRDFANTEIASRMQFQERQDSSHMGGGTVDPGNTSSTPGTGSFVRPSTGSTPALAAGPHSKPKLNRTDGHLSSGGLPSAPGSNPNARPIPAGSVPQQPIKLSPQPQQPYPQQLAPEPGQQQPAINPQPPTKGNTQFRPYDPQKGQ